MSDLSLPPLDFSRLFSPSKPETLPPLDFSNLFTKEEEENEPVVPFDLFGSVELPSQPLANFNLIPSPLAPLPPLNFDFLACALPTMPVVTTFVCPCGGSITVENAVEGQQAICPTCWKTVSLTFNATPASESGGSSLLGTLAKIALAVAGAYAVYKVGQSLLNEDYGTRNYPPQVRRKLIEQHVAMHGSFCFDCNRKVPRSRLTIDHWLAWANGGTTSWMNARVICGPCNSGKRDRNSWTDRLLGC